MRPLIAAICFVPALANADEFYVDLPVVAVTVYSQGATETRATQLDLPAGTHQIIVPSEMMFDGWALPSIAFSGDVRLVAVTQGERFVGDRSPYLSPAQEQAVQAVEDAETALWAHDQETAALLSEIAGLEASLAFLRGLSGDAGDVSDAESLLEIVGVLGQEVQSTTAQVADVKHEITTREQDRYLLASALEYAENELWRLSPPLEGFGEVAVLTVEASQALVTDMEVFTYADASWEPQYEFYLDRDSGVVTVAQNAMIYSNNYLRWHDVALTLSTQNPAGQAAPSVVYENLAQIVEEGPVSIRSQPQLMAAAPEPLVIEETMDFAGGVVTANDYAANYSFDTPQTILSDFALLSLSSHSFDADLNLSANPRHDTTAFLVAEFANDSGVLLGAGEAQLYRDNVWVSDTYFDGLADGESAEMGFGAFNGVQLSYVDLTRQEGSRGVITTETTLEQVYEYRIENLTDAHQDVQVLAALPFGENEELRINMNVTPRPDEIDVDDKRNVAMWDVALPANSTATVRVDVNMRWPTGYQLIWRP